MKGLSLFGPESWSIEDRTALSICLFYRFLSLHGMDAAVLPLYNSRFLAQTKGRREREGNEEEGKGERERRKGKGNCFLFLPLSLFLRPFVYAKKKKKNAFFAFFFYPITTFFSTTHTSRGGQEKTAGVRSLFRVFPLTFQGKMLF